MKNKRQETIINLIEEKQLKTHDDIIDELISKGYNVTQATVSRDIKELNLQKKNGYYTLPEELRQRHRARIFSVSVTGIEYNESLIVIHTTPGAASLIASTVDETVNDFILGTIAGDDTIFVATRMDVSTEEVYKHLLEVFS